MSGPYGAERFILARSADRRAKEQAMHQRFLERMETGLKKRQAAAESGRLHREVVAYRRLGRLHERCRRATRAFDVTIAPIPGERPPEPLLTRVLSWRAC
ncbi:MAG: hypothetical protein V2A79_03295 [Planctomycetota bacterium]